MTCMSWKMNFNASKCKVMSVCREVKHNFNYVLNHVHLERVSRFNDLGVIITHDLSWKDHINSKIAKSHQMLGLIKRGLGYCAPVKVKKLFYTSLVKSCLSYCSIIWNPNKQELLRIESVQRRATKYILGGSTSPYKARLKELGMLPLSYSK